MLFRILLRDAMVPEANDNILMTDLELYGKQIVLAEVKGDRFEIPNGFMELSFDKIDMVKIITMYRVRELDYMYIECLNDNESLFPKFNKDSNINKISKLAKKHHLNIECINFKGFGDLWLKFMRNGCIICNSKDILKPVMEIVADALQT